jgi:hypothetical protein
MGFFAELKKEWPVIFTAPRVALTYAVASAVVIWGVTHWEYASVIASKDEEIKSKNEQLQTKQVQLDSKDDQIRFSERQRDDYKEKLGGATPSEAKAQIEDLERKLKSLEPRIAVLEPRRLSEEQKQAIIASARHSSDTYYALVIAHEGACGDCDGYAGQISFAFHEAGGWDIQQPFVMGPSMKSPKGISLVIRGAAQEEGSVVARALKAAKIEFDTFPVASAPVMGLPPIEIIVAAAIEASLIQR